MIEVKTNKITVYLLKEGKTIENALRDKDNYTRISFNDYDNKEFYYGPSYSYQPKWIAKFFNSELDNINLFNQSSKAVFFTKIEINGTERIFVIPFAYGYSMIDKISCVEDFGLKLVLNVVDRNSIRKIGKRTLSSEPKNTIEQLSKIGKISDFGIDIEQDLVEEITGKPKVSLETEFGKSLVTGKMAFTISTKVNIENIDDFLSKFHEYYIKEDYRDDFAFIDQVKKIRDNTFLNEKLIKKIKDNSILDTKVWMAIPEIIEWEEIAGFSFTGKNDNLFSDITYEAYKDSLTDEQVENITIDFLKNKIITAFKNTDDNEYKHWSAFYCLYCEVEEQEHRYILTNGEWYEIAKDFVDDIEQNYSNVLNNSTSISLINAEKNEKENEYNKRLANSLNNAILMDRKNIRYGGGASAIEFCDVYDKNNKRFIHIKNYYSSSALSHLFAQGKVSGQLFLNDEKFREAVKQKENSLPFNPNDKPNSTDYSIIFGIISEAEEDLNLPFFSKVNLKNEKKLLEAFGFQNIYLVKIQREKN